MAGLRFAVEKLLRLLVTAVGDASAVVLKMVDFVFFTSARNCRFRTALTLGAAELFMPVVLPAHEFPTGDTRVPAPDVLDNQP